MLKMSTYTLKIYYKNNVKILVNKIVSVPITRELMCISLNISNQIK